MSFLLQEPEQELEVSMICSEIKWVFSNLS